jgi:hypothetical protein
MSGETWFDALMDYLATQEGESRRAAARVAIGTLLRVARAEWLAADKLTGRGVSTSHETVARQLELSTKTVKRARDLLVALGFAVVVVRGRHLNSSERAEARALHGRFQDRAASLRALTVPRPSSTDENVTPPRSGAVNSSSDLPEVENQRAQARSGRHEPLPLPRSDRPRRQNTPQRRQDRPGVPIRRPRSCQPWPEAEYRFADELRNRLPALREYHPSTICRLLDRTHIAAARWTVTSLLDAIALSSQARGGIPFAAAADQRNPLAYLAQVLRNSIDPLAETPVEASRRRRQSQLDEQFARRREEAALRARLAAERDAEISASAKPLETDTSEPQAMQTTARTIPEAVLGEGSKPYQHPVATQLLVGDLTNLHRAFLDLGWHLRSASPGGRELTWARRSPEPADVITLTLTITALGDAPHVDAVSAPVDLDSLGSSGALPHALLTAIITG